ncbi:hypothetical protein R1sor_026440 [Riccia sorocarpa]|uniref:Uncharacterized protein n=1 Tax=Riccia sorocarpa TaxID=122646 RepID=A0ABD3GE81_9MARC
MESVSFEIDMTSESHEPPSNPSEWVQNEQPGIDVVSVKSNEEQQLEVSEQEEVVKRGSPWRLHLQVHVGEADHHRPPVVAVEKQGGGQSGDS